MRTLTKIIAIAIHLNADDLLHMILPKL